jgi:gliding motility-associated-like protein
MQIGKTIVLLLVIFIPIITTGQVLQEGCDVSGFGVDADCYANGLQFGEDSTLISNSDDWFLNSAIYSGAGIGVIDTTGTSVIKTALEANINVSFPRPMAFSSNTVINSIRYMDAIYSRDFYGGFGATDFTSFLTAAKNGDDPSIWSTGPNNVTPKTDLIDCYGHLRRDGLTTAGPLWLFLGFSRVSNSGSSYFDAELFAQTISYDGVSGFSSGGPNEGHKAWEFDNFGNIIEIGDLAVSTEFSTNTAPIIELRIWISRYDFNNISPATFNFGTQFDGSSNSSLYGYVDVIPLNPNVGCGLSNPSNTAAPPWGTLNSGGGYSTVYEKYQFAEFGINLTAFGIDPADLEGIDACDTPFSSILYKSRTSASFTSSLKDFNGPIEFKDIPEVPVIATTDTLDCYNPIGVLTILDTLDGSYYEWQTPDGNIISNPYSSIIEVDQPGTYIAFGAPMQGCDQIESDTVYVLSNIIAINANIESDTVWDCALETNLYGFPNGFGYNWTGPNAFFSTDQQISVTESGIYILEVYDLFSGCNEFDTIYVMDYPCEHLISTTLPPGIDYTIMVDTIFPTFTVPVDLTIDCNSDPTDLNLTGDVNDEADDCDPFIGEATYSDVISINDPCIGAAVITRTWTLTDACGNTTTDIQVITLVDTTAPTFTVPVDITIECDLDPNDLINTGDVTDESDNCDSSLGEASYTDIVNVGDPCAGSFTIVRTWTLADACGNTTTNIQMITLEDTTAPTFTLPADITLECDQDPNDLNFTGDVTNENDNCTNPIGEATYSDNISINDPCIGATLIIRTWTLSDACGNINNSVQTITLEDSTAPTFTVPTDITIECDIDPNDLSFTGDVINESDNCNNPVGEATYSDNIISNTPCTGAVVINRTWTLSDDCGNTNSAIQTITLEDSTAPTFTVPIDITIECDIDPNDLSFTGDVTDESDNCINPVGEAVYTDIVSANPLCAPAVTINRTWTLTDACGNSTSAIQTITLEDTTAPDFTVPADITIECDQDPNDLTLTGDVIDESDNCDSSVGEATFTDQVFTGDFCNGSSYILRTWELVDACGNDTSIVQTIMIEDSTPPTFSILAGNPTIECDSVAAMPVIGIDIFVNDNCDSNVDITFSETIIEGACANTYLLTRTWVATDNCGNQDSISQVINYEDTNNPIIISFPENVTIECNDTIPSADLEVIDNCDSDIEVNISDVIIGGVCPSSYTIERTYTWLDNCGNQNSYIQTISVEDTTPPSFTVPADITIQCDQDPNDLNLTGNVIDGNDICDPSLGQATYTDFITNNNPCSGASIITRTWTLIDACGNDSSSVQIITMEDTTPPTFTVPGDVTLECDQDPNDLILTGDVIDESDNCDTSIGEATYTDQIISDTPCDGAFIVMRTWSLIDACGNTQTDEQILTFEDTTPPVLIGVPSDATVECDAIPLAPVVSATDNCSSNLTVNYNEIIGTGCPYIITRTWDVTDGCGNSFSTSQNITVEDTTSPVLLDVADDVIIECADCFNSFLNGDFETPPHPNGNNTGQLAGGNPNNWVYWHQDIVTGWQTASNDNIIELHASGTNGLISASGNQHAELNADQDSDFYQEFCTIPTTIIQISFAHAKRNKNSNTSDDIMGVFIGPDLNNLTQILTATATDFGVWTYHTINYSVPVGQNSTVFLFRAIQGSPGNVLEGNCIDDINIITLTDTDFIPNVTDNCDANVELSISSEVIYGGCENQMQIIRTWTAIDDCGNIAQDSQLVSIGDFEDPVLYNVPSDLTLQCDDIIPDPPIVSVTDNCSADLTVDFYETITSYCGYTITRTWTAIDICDNTVIETQVITIEDTTPPSFTLPPDVTMECDIDPDDLNITGEVTDGIDNCDPSVGNAIYSDSISIDDPCTGAAIIFRTWYLVDGCGNDTSAVQIITLEDTTPPGFTVPSDITLECDIDPNDLAFTGEVTDESDNCDSSIGEATYTDQILPNTPCVGALIIMRTWSLSDGCGNILTDEQIITLEDTTPPTFTVPLDVTLECGQDANDLNTTGEVVDESDNCDPTLGQATYSDVISNDDPCIGTTQIFRTWTLTDGCGNITSEIQTITLEDTTPPEFTVPADITLECGTDPDDLSFTGEVTDESDNCDTSIGDATYSDAISSDDPCVGAMIITRTWTLTDDCGNNTTGIQIITLEDTTPPDFTIPADITLECDTDPNDLTFTGDVSDESDNCDSSLGQATYSDMISPNDPCIGAMIITRVWTLSDACGNDSTGVQIITLQDTIPPVLLNIPQDTIVNCNSIPAVPAISATDACDTSINVDFNEMILDGPCVDVYTIIRTWTATDNCGNSSSGSQEILVQNCGAEATIDISPDSAICENEFITFTTSVSSEYNSPNYQWQYSTDGITWIDIQGETDSTLTFQASIEDEGWYRVVVANDSSGIGDPQCSILSNQILLTVLLNASPVNLEVSICEGTTYTLGNATYSTAGNYTEIFVAGNGCDSVVNLHLELLPKYAIAVNESICEGESYIIGNSVYTTSGNYTDTLQSIEGCDSIVSLDLIVFPVSTVSRSEVICEGESYIIGNNIYNETGIYSDTLQSYQGCDSIIVLELLVNPIQHINLAYEICQGESVTIGTSVYSTPGLYTNVLQSYTGCDSIVHLNLQVYPNYSVYQNAQICEGDSITIGNSVYTTSGIYTNVFNSIHGCDSIITTNLLVADPLYSTMDVVICNGDSLQTSNSVFTESGTFYDTLTAIGGCDSIVTIELIVLDKIETALSEEICRGEYVQVGNILYWDTGTYSNTFISTNGCDSTVILDLLVYPNKDTLISVTGCEGTGYSMGGQVYNETGIYSIILSTIHGCDSTVTLELNLLPEVVTNLEVGICDEEEYILNNITYNTTGQYTQTLIAQAGCDSIIKLNLTVFEIVETFDEIIICEGDSALIFNQFESVPDTYTQIYAAQNGCDSIVFIELILEPQVELFVDDEVICEGESVQLFVEGASNVVWSPPYGLSCTECPNPIASPGATTTYTVSAESCLGTITYTEITVEVNYPPILEVTGNISLLKGDSALLEAAVNDPSAEIIWTTSYGDTLCVGCYEMLIQPDFSTSYIVTAIDSDGCIDQEEVDIEIRDECREGEILIPNFITPNGDGANDRLEIRYSGVKEVSLLRIYNRWGELVFETKDVDTHLWNGKFLDRELNPGVYVYYLEVYCLNNEIFIYKGNVTIIK